MFDPSAVLVISNGNNPAVFGMVTEVMKFSPDVISCDDGKIAERLAAGNIACIICFARECTDSMQQLIYRYVCGKSDAVCVCFTESDNDEKMFTTSVFGEECKLVIGTKLMLIPIDTDVATLRNMMLLVLGEYAEKTDNKAMTEAYWRVIRTLAAGVVRKYDCCGRKKYGCVYLTIALMIVSDDPDRLDLVTKTLYPDIAEKTKTSAANVDRSMRHALYGGWKRSGGRFSVRYRDICSVDFDLQPRNREFIGEVSMYLAVRYRYIYDAGKRLAAQAVEVPA